MKFSLFLLIILFFAGCSPLVELTPRDIKTYELTKPELERVQYYFDIFNEAEFKSTDRVTRKKNVRKSLIFRILRKKYSLGIKKKTPGMLIMLDNKYPSKQPYPEYLEIQFDQDISPLKFQAKSGYYILNPSPIIHQNISYDILNHEPLLLYIRQSELEKIIKNRKNAKGLLVNPNLFQLIWHKIARWL